MAPTSPCYPAATKASKALRRQRHGGVSPPDRVAVTRKEPPRPGHHVGTIRDVARKPGAPHQTRQSALSRRPRRTPTDISTPVVISTNPHSAKKQVSRSDLHNDAGAWQEAKRGAQPNTQRLVWANDDRSARSRDIRRHRVNAEIRRAGPRGPYCSAQVMGTEP